MHCNVTVVTTNLACWGWEIWNELKTNTSLQFIIEAIRKLEQKPTSNSSTQDLQAMWPIQELIQMRGRANLPKECSFQPHFTDLRPIQSFTPAPEGLRQPSHSLVFISISHLSYHISKEWDGKLSSHSWQPVSHMTVSVIVQVVCNMCIVCIVIDNALL